MAAVDAIEITQRDNGPPGYVGVVMCGLGWIKHKHSWVIVGKNWQKSVAEVAGLAQCAGVEGGGSLGWRFTGSAGRPLPGAWGNLRPPGGGKSGLHRARWWVTPTTRRLRGSLACPLAEGSGKCNRKQTAWGGDSPGKGEKVGRFAA